MAAGGRFRESVGSRRKEATHGPFWHVQGTAWHDVVLMSQ